MSRLFKIGVLTAVVVIVGYVYLFFFSGSQYHYDIEFYHSFPCAYLFTPAGNRGIDPFPMICGRIRKTDQIYTCIYKQDYYVMVWKIDGLRNADLNKIPINQNVYLDHVQLYPGQILDTGIEEEVKDGPFFRRRIEVDVDEYSKIEKSFHGPHYRGFYGTLNKIAFQNDHGQIMTMVNYTHRITPSLFVMYKGHGSFYIIIINSHKPFGLGMLKILNLK